MPDLIATPQILDLDSEEYHRHPAVSSTLLRRMLPPSAPALARWLMLNPEPPKDAYDLGHVAHALVLGKGERFTGLDYSDWRTKAAKDERDELRAAGTVPLLAKDLTRAEAMADRVLAHPVASVLFEAGTGEPERSIFWTDEETGLGCRAMLDWYAPGMSVDLKTTASASPSAIAKSVASYGYHQQEAHYTDGRVALTGEVVPFLFVFVEVDPPHLVTVVQLHEDAVDIGRDRNRRAMQLYKECISSGVWPGYSSEIETIDLPKWAKV